MDTIKETIEEQKEKSRKFFKKLVAIALSTGLIAVGTVAAIEHIPDAESRDPNIMNPEPVVLEIDDIDMAEEAEDEEENQDEKKRGVLGWLKIWLYGVAAGIAGFFATKIPWKKIFTKRNLIILLVLIAVFLCAKYILPYFVDLPWGPDPKFGTSN